MITNRTSENVKREINELVFNKVLWFTEVFTTKRLRLENVQRFIELQNTN
ncbi:MAG: hypothetical protein GWN56_16555 [Nitrosopumilaceae archaeon]|nr:hypothetical protein [Nitrosopumilaceae archaeon]